MKWTQAKRDAQSRKLKASWANRKAASAKVEVMKTGGTRRPPPKASALRTPPKFMMLGKESAYGTARGTALDMYPATATSNTSADWVPASAVSAKATKVMKVAIARTVLHLIDIDYSVTFAARALARLVIESEG